MDPSGTGLKVVIVDDNVGLVEIYKTRLGLQGYQCFGAYDGVEALSVIEREKPALVLLDLMVPKIAGDQILERMRASEWGHNIKVLIMSNLNEADAPPGLRNHGIEGYAVKANLTDDALDKLVDEILKPAGQKEDVSLEATETSVPAAATPAMPPAAAQPTDNSQSPPNSPAPAPSPPADPPLPTAIPPEQPTAGL